ncbi:hypothetical protein NDU88_002792 [Pleurodeles waltl]|uniref:Uncharacterized protein n=1 Tax=Pleurodeles waltl TaxID=8319 RepID=A0AAV7QB05_PLEWA|nr:hypothetical protein NDU88_002792 [Pleurodeles waltl]
MIRCWMEFATMSGVSGEDHTALSLREWDRLPGVQRPPVAMLGGQLHHGHSGHSRQAASKPGILLQCKNAAQSYTILFPRVLSSSHSLDEGRNAHPTQEKVPPEFRSVVTGGKGLCATTVPQRT